MRRSNVNRWAMMLAGVACWLLLSTSLRAQMVEIVKDNGLRLRGQLVSETDETVTIADGDKRVTIDRADIRSMRTLKTVQQEYQEKRRRLKDSDVDGRYGLAAWLFDKGAYELAMTELASLEKLAPQQRRIQFLKSQVQRRLAALDKKADMDGEGDDAESAVGDAPHKAKRRPGIDVLSPEQINLIRVFEIDLRSRPAVVVPKETVDIILSKYPDDDLLGDSNRNRFKGARGYVKLEKMFELAQDYPEVRELYKDVIVRADPPGLLTFRKRIHRSIAINYCGTANCHGSEAGESLRLIRQRPTSDETVYTNFFLLQDFRKPTSRYDMIDRQQPHRSLLIQYALPRNSSREPHPEVDGWQPLLRPSRDARTQHIIDWIRQLQRRQPNYGFKFPPPKKKGRTPPRDQPDDDKKAPQTPARPDP